MKANALLILGSLAAGLYGINRSLWLDEAWVANSVNAPTLGGMFYYSDWLQTSPPLFLLLERSAVRVFGLSNISLRIVPLLFALVAAVGMLAVSRRVLSSSFALLAGALVVFNPVAIEFSHSAKQYSGELAAAALLLLASVQYAQNPDRRNYYWLLGTLAFSLFLAYPAIFFLPGVLLLAARPARAACSAAVAGTILAVLFVLFVRPNYSPELRAFWAADESSALTPGLAAALLFCAAAAIRAALTRERIQILCLMPCILLAAAAATGWYPATPRTRLFVLPCFVLLTMMIAEDLLRRFPIKFLDTAAAVIALVVVALAGWRQVREHRNLPEEDFAGAVRYLQQRVGPADLLLIHASAREGFRLYASMYGFAPPRALFGETGWPCCARGKMAAPGSSTAAAVLRDLDAKVPRGFSGRVWLFYTSRPSHWKYVGMDEGNFWRSDVWRRGCPPADYVAFENLAVSPMDCR